MHIIWFVNYSMLYIPD